MLQKWANVESTAKDTIYQQKLRCTYLPVDAMEHEAEEVSHCCLCVYYKARADIYIFFIRSTCQYQTAADR